MTAYDVGGRSILLVFARGASIETVALEGGVIPGHDGAGPLHCAFAISADELPAWKERLNARGVQIEGCMDWPRGGKKASISAIRTATFSNSRRPVFGRPTK